ncbi:MAG TPA: ATP-binding protein [Candidatus Acidoferrales bacterium]|nr:ATP-binding protein [Candidatus Acidoferrales bacterium]
MADSPSTRPPKTSYRKQVIILLSISVFLLLAILVSETAFDLKFLNPGNNQDIVVFSALSALIFLLFVALTFVLMRNLLKLFAERRLGVLGSKFRTRMVAGALLLSSLPVVVMYWFAYGLMNRSIDKWFSAPVEEVRADTNAMASLLADYAAQNARAEAAAIAASPETERDFAGHGYSGILTEFQHHELTLQGGFALAVRDGNAEASFNAPAAWLLMKDKLPIAEAEAGHPVKFMWQNTEYTLGVAPVQGGMIVVAIPLPRGFSETVRQVETSQQRYYNLARERRVVRRTYMGLLLLLTMSVLFVTTWLALFLSKIVTRPLSALAEATQAISRGQLDYRVDVSSADEIGDLVRSFNRMAEDLESSRRQIEASSRDLSAANAELDQRRRQIETILESIPTGVLSLDADRRVTHVNQAMLRMFHPDPAYGPGTEILLGASLAEVFPAEVLEDFEFLLRRGDRMGMSTSQIEMQFPRGSLNVAVTVATLRHQGERSGYVVVFEDLSDLLKAQKQAAWREVARRVAHEIKNPLTPISLSAERIQRHLDRATPDDPASMEVVRSCAETIAGAVETVRQLVDEFSTLARFPVAKPQPADINEIIENSLAMFNGRLDGIVLHKSLASDLPRVMADSEAIKRAIANLVDNAAEASQDSVVREIGISTTLVGSRDAIEITVADTGHGVTRELKEKLFLPYFSTKKRGTGLGLSIVSRIVEDHHGSIRVEKNEPVGSRFIIEIPVIPESLPVPVTARHA